MYNVGGYLLYTVINIETEWAKEREGNRQRESPRKYVRKKLL